mmetsp:Transcript_286/g.612  ORF Transcript_286/g.612 Transcript_286/m.612 type:complete len:539 (+) Transcript_286:234-1850(+)
MRYPRMSQTEQDGQLPCGVFRRKTGVSSSCASESATQSTISSKNKNINYSNTTAITSSFDSDLDHCCQGAAWVLSKNFRDPGDEVDYYKLRGVSNMIPMQDELIQRYKADRERLNQQMAARVQSLPDATMEDYTDDSGTTTMVMKHIQNAEKVLGMKQPRLRRPGPDVEGGLDDSEHDLAAAHPMVPRFRKPQATVQSPPKPIRGSCQCCFEEISSTSSLPCSRSSQSYPTHSFCKECLRRYVQEWVFGGADYPLRHRTLPCLAADCGSDGYIPHEVIEQVCSPPLWEQYQEKIFRMEAASQSLPVLDASSRSYSDPPEVMGGLADDTHPFYRSTKPRSTSFDVAEDKQGETKKKVDSKVHAKKRLAGHIKKFVSRGDKTRAASSCHDDNPDVNKVAEAMTEAKVRKCPACQVSFLKESGCNKMKCPNCRTYMCYICREPVLRVGYDHFCQHAYDSCRRCYKCPLWTRNDEREDQARVQEVATNEAGRLWEQTLLQRISNADADVSDSIPIVNVDELLQAGDTKKTSRPGLFGRLKKR